MDPFKHQSQGSAGSSSTNDVYPEQSSSSQQPLDMVTNYLLDDQSFADFSMAPPTCMPIAAGFSQGQFSPVMTSPMMAPGSGQAMSSAYAGSGSSSSRNVEEESTGRQQREGYTVAFRMETEVDNLDDGFKWRKYGKKSVKNSPNPRNYYRCSTEGCTVKKRVERDPEDPKYVITTYEGVHNHPSPGVVYYTTQDDVSGRFVLAGCQVLPTTSRSSS